MIALVHRHEVAASVPGPVAYARASRVFRDSCSRLGLLIADVEQEMTSQDEDGVESLHTRWVVSRGWTT